MYEFERDSAGRIPDIHPREIRISIPVDGIIRAVDRCRASIRSEMLPDQQQSELAMANALSRRISGNTTHEDSLYCNGDERQFVTCWSGEPNERLNGTQRLALSMYREGRYASSRMVSEIAGADNGMAWSLVRHMRPTTDPAVAARQLERTFARLCVLAQSMQAALNKQMNDAADLPSCDSDDAPGHNMKQMP